MENLESMTLRSVLERSIRKFAKEPALSQVDGDILTFSEFGEAVQSLSEQLRELGIGTGDKVAILSENTPNWGIAYFAITTMGAIAVPILPEFHPDAIHHILRHSESKAAFISEKLFSKVEDSRLDPEPQFLLMETFYPVELETDKDRLKELKAAGRREFRKLRGKAKQLMERDIAESDVAVIIYTSGTTGHSKGVVLTHKNIVFNAFAVKTIVEVGPGDRMLSILPLAHTYECTLGLVLPILNGVHVSYLDKPPTARALLPAMAKIKPTAMLAVPLVIEKIFKTAILPKLTGSRVKRALYNIPTIRRILHTIAGKSLLEKFGGELRIFCIGGAAIAPEVERFLHEAKFPYAIGYGLTETSPLASGDNPQKTRLYATGRPLAGVQVRILDEDASGEGEILVKGPNVMREYYKAPEITQAAFTEEGWFRTGDLGRFDADGYLSIRGRLKNVIVGPSGENIYPEEIETFIHQSSWVLESIVFQQESKLVARIHIDYSKVDEEFGNLAAAKMKTKVDALLEEIRQDVNSKVSSFSKLRKVIEQTEPFEKTPTHKIKRYLYVD